jgi:hypothetical protein
MKEFSHPRIEVSTPVLYWKHPSRPPTLGIVGGLVQQQPDPKEPPTILAAKVWEMDMGGDRPQWVLHDYVRHKDDPRNEIGWPKDGVWEQAPYMRRIDAMLTDMGKVHVNATELEKRVAYIERRMAVLDKNRKETVTA